MEKEVLVKKLKEIGGYYFDFKEDIIWRSYDLELKSESWELILMFDYSNDKEDDTLYQEFIDALKWQINNDIQDIECKEYVKVLKKILKDVKNLKKISDQSILEEYIKFAMDHWYDWREVHLIWNNYTCDDKTKFKLKVDEGSVSIYYLEDENDEEDEWELERRCDLIRVITRKTFIESIARWIVWKNHPEVHNDFTKEELKDYDFSSFIEEITIQQSIAIREEKLEEFIINLWIHGKKK